jgi:hypothetical protein
MFKFAIQTKTTTPQRAAKKQKGTIEGKRSLVVNTPNEGTMADNRDNRTIKGQLRGARPCVGLQGGLRSLLRGGAGAMMGRTQQRPPGASGPWWVPRGCISVHTKQEGVARQAHRSREMRGTRDQWANSWMPSLRMSARTQLASWEFLALDPVFRFTPARQVSGATPARLTSRGLQLAIGTLRRLPRRECWPLIAGGVHSQTAAGGPEPMQEPETNTSSARSGGSGQTLSCWNFQVRTGSGDWNLEKQWSGACSRRLAGSQATPSWQSVSET